MDQDTIAEVLTRLRVPEKIIKVITEIYSHPRFKVTHNGIDSQIYEQEAGIRQGCPLSPYLFVLIMTVLFDDIHHICGEDLLK